MIALGKYVLIKPIGESPSFISFDIRRKIQTGILVDKGDDVCADSEWSSIENGSKVYYHAGNHNSFNEFILMNYKAVAGYEKNTIIQK